MSLLPQNTVLLWQRGPPVWGPPQEPTGTGNKAWRLSSAEPREQFIENDLFKNRCFHGLRGAG